jgi:protein SCO1
MFSMTRKNAGLFGCLLLASSLVAIAASPVARADEMTSGRVKVGIVEKLGQRIPMNLVFKDEYGSDITLAQIANGKPLIIDMAYYECPGICDVVLGGLKKIVDDIPQTPGKDFNVATISFNPADNQADALKKKTQFWGTLDRFVPASAWRFLTGDSAEIYSLTNSLGFNFIKDNHGMFIHPTALIIVNKDGKIIRYIQGTSFALANLKVALLEAESGTPEQIIGSTPQVCFSHNPAGNVVADHILQLGGAGTLVFVAGFLVFLKSKRKPGKDESKVS